ncbi:hypothetical protein [Bacillus cereus group sp. IBL03679]|uniref:hypothetical protein n=1 Tax=Bacillus cereus group sp. IBL03679 TaxID=3240095 RepID=UPI003D2F88A4
MAMLDTSLIQHIGEKRYYEILRTLELQEAKSFRYYDNRGKQHKLTQKEVLKRMNRRLPRHNQSPISLSWVKKWWNK